MKLRKLIKKVIRRIDRFFFNILFPEEVLKILSEASSPSNKLLGITIDEKKGTNVGVIIFNKSLIDIDIITPIAKFIFKEIGIDTNIIHIYSDKDFNENLDYIIMIGGHGGKIPKKNAVTKIDNFSEKIKNNFSFDIDSLWKFNEIFECPYPHWIVKNKKIQ